MLRTTGRNRPPQRFASKSLADDSLADDSAAGSSLQDLAQKRRRGPSLKARAISLLSRRDQSRFELQRKLAQFTESEDAAGATAEIDAVIQALELEGFFSETRFAQSFARRRGERYGTARVKQELQIHKLDGELLVATITSLKDSEFERGYEVWSRRFDGLAPDATARAKQQRFLAGRGFSMAVIARIMKGEAPDTDALT